MKNWFNSNEDQLDVLAYAIMNSRRIGTTWYLYPNSTQFVLGRAKTEKLSDIPAGTFAYNEGSWRYFPNTTGIPIYAVFAPEEQYRQAKLLAYIQGIT